MRFSGVFNHSGGTFQTIDMRAFSARAELAFAQRGIALDVHIVDGDSLNEALEAAASNPQVDALLVGGGDGTISAAAAVCFRTGKPLAVLPAGTMNFFARALHVPLALDAALEAIAGGQLYRVDIATANGRPFLNQYSVGLHARLIRIRENLSYGGRVAKMLAGLRAVSGAVSRPLRFEVDIQTPDGPERRLASGIVVSNNLMAEGHLPYADDLTGGTLGVYLAKPMTPNEALRLIAQVMLGRWKAHPRVLEREVAQVTLTFPKRKRNAVAAIDGELVPLEPRVDLRSHPRGLTVFAPQELAQFVSPVVRKGQAPEAAQ